jgi:hypothetical protein
MPLDFTTLSKIPTMLLRDVDNMIALVAQWCAGITRKDIAFALMFYAVVRMAFAHLRLERLLSEKSEQARTLMYENISACQRSSKHWHEAQRLELEARSTRAGWVEMAEQHLFFFDALCYPGRFSTWTLREVLDKAQLHPGRRGLVLQKAEERWPSLGIDFVSLKKCNENMRLSSQQVYELVFLIVQNNWSDANCISK